MKFSLYCSLCCAGFSFLVAGCQDPAAQSFAPPATAQTAPIATGVLTPPAHPTPQTSVLVYRADPDCTTLIADPVQLPQTESLAPAVGAAIAQFNSADFSIMGYRVKLDQQRQIATVELRLAADGARSWSALSTCEELALFGGIRATILNHPQWSIQAVEFVQVDPHSIRSE